MFPCVARLSVVICGVAAIHLRRGDKAEWSWGFDESKANATALRLFEAWDRENGATAPHPPGVDLADKDAWPDVKPSGGWDLGLKSPQAFVVSMAQRAARRKNFKKRFQEVGWNLAAEWMPAVEGAKCPIELRWLKGFEDKSSWDYDKPGNWGCYLSHLALLRKSHARCPTCDLVVFEDDAVFVPKFKERWASFMEAVPKDWSILRLGAQSLWEPSYEATPEYVHASSVSNTWGYVVRADAVEKLAKGLAELPVKGAWGVDAVMQLFTQELKTFVPRVPLVQAVGGCSDSSAKNPGHGCDLDTDAGLKERLTQLVARWPQGYFRTYCVGKGAMRPGHQPLAKISETACADTSSYTCCPYDNPPEAAM